MIIKKKKRVQWKTLMCYGVYFDVLNYTKHGFTSEFA